MMMTNELLATPEEIAKLIRQKTDADGQFKGDSQKVILALELLKKEILLAK